MFVSSGKHGQQSSSPCRQNVPNNDPCRCYVHCICAGIVFVCVILLLLLFLFLLFVVPVFFTTGPDVIMFTMLLVISSIFLSYLVFASMTFSGWDNQVHCGLFAHRSE